MLISIWLTRTRSGTGDRVESGVLAAVEFCAKQRDASNIPKNTTLKFKWTNAGLLALQSGSILRLVHPPKHAKNDACATGLVHR